MKSSFILPLFVPADRPDRFSKALSSGTDAVIIDLEDAVSPLAKINAREFLKNGLDSLINRETTSIYVRINGTETPWFSEDLELVSKLEIDGIVLPMTENSEEILQIKQTMGSNRSVIALVESAKGLASIRSFAAIVEKIAFGSIDFCADLGCAHERTALLAARSEIILASRLAGLEAPIDGVTTSIHDKDLVTSDAQYAQRLGFSGKLLIHPSQIIPARVGFAPTPDEIVWAEKILSATQDGAAIAVDGQMVDAPVLARAKTILSKI